MNTNTNNDDLGVSKIASSRRSAGSVAQIVVRRICLALVLAGAVGGVATAMGNASQLSAPAHMALAISDDERASRQQMLDRYQFAIERAKQRFEHADFRHTGDAGTAARVDAEPRHTSATIMETRGEG